MAIIVGTANIQNNPDLSRYQVVQCGRLIGFKKPDFIGFQELVERSDHRDILIGMGKQYALTDDTENAIGYNKRKWQLIHHIAELATPGVGSITPNLYIVTATFKRRVPFGQTVTVINTHLVPLTLHGKPRSDYGHREDMWKTHWGMLQKIASDSPYPTFVTGDFNNIAFHFTMGDKILVSGGLDRIFALNRGARIDVIDRFDVPNPSDHNTRMVKVRIKR